MSEEKKNKWVSLHWADRIPHGQLCIVAGLNENGETEYHLARLDRNRDAWVTEPEHKLSCGGEFVMLVPEAPCSDYVMDKKDSNGCYEKLPINQ